MRRLALAGVLVAGMAGFVALRAQEEPSAGHATEGELQGEVSHGESEEHDNVTLWKTVNFVLLAAGLIYLLRKPVKNYFTSATAGIRQGIDEATQARLEAEARAADMGMRLTNLETEIASLRAHAKEEMAAEDARLRKQSEQELDRVQARARQEIASAAAQARKQLRAEAAQLAMDLAKQKVGQRMTPEVSGQLIDSFVQELNDTARRTS